MEYKKLKVIISGGGTGGHIFPAISIADKLRETNPDTEILFVGAEGRMEMEKVPAAGYRIEGLPITGLQRQLNLKNIINNAKVPFKVISSLCKAGRIIREFKPDIAVGVGGYASAPLLWKATSMKVPTLIQEQNGFAGLTNRKLSKKVGRICVAYEGMSKFFPEDKIVMTGNPIRAGIHRYGETEKAEGVAFYGFDPTKKHILLAGGSLGSKTLNNAVKAWIEEGCPGGDGVQLLWQCGKYYEKEISAFMEGRNAGNIKYGAFVSRMDLAYAMADIVISRSGASSISEICAAAKASVLVPSPNVAEDHQTHNAMALVNNGAAIMVKDCDAVKDLFGIATGLVHDAVKIQEMEENAFGMALPDAAGTIVKEIYRLVK